MFFDNFTATAYGYGTSTPQRAAGKSKSTAKKPRIKKSAAKGTSAKKSAVKKTVAKKAAMKKAGTMQNTAKVI